MKSTWVKVEALCEALVSLRLVELLAEMEGELVGSLGLVGGILVGHRA